MLDVRKQVLDICKQLNNKILSWTCLSPTIAPQLMSAVETRNPHRLNGRTDHSQAMTKIWAVANLLLMYTSQTQGFKLGRLLWLVDILPLYIVSAKVSWVKWVKNNSEDVLRWTGAQILIPDSLSELIVSSRNRFCDLIYWQFSFTGRFWLRCGCYSPSIISVGIPLVLDCGGVRGM